MQHHQDTDCFVNPDTNLCYGCGVDHSGECVECGGRGFHKNECPLIEARPFDLDKALAGAELVTRDGRPAKQFRRITRHTPAGTYSYEALVSGKSLCYTSNGTYWLTRRDPADLFIIGEQA